MHISHHNGGSVYDVVYTYAHAFKEVCSVYPKLKFRANGLSREDGKIHKSFCLHYMLPVSMESVDLLALTNMETVLSKFSFLFFLLYSVFFNSFSLF